MKKENLGSVKALKKQLGTAVAMVCVAAVALGSSTYAWFVSNNQVTATTTQIAAQSNSAYLVIDKVKTSQSSTNAATAGETVGESGTYKDAKLYPAQWKNGFNVDKENGKAITADKPAIYQFETAYASAKTVATEKNGTRFAIGDPKAAVDADYALLNTFYVGTGTYDGEFTNLKVSDITVTDKTTTGLKTAMRLLIMTYAPTKGNDEDTVTYGTTATAWAVAKYDGTTSKLAIESQSIDTTNDANLVGVVYQNQFGKSEGDVKVEVYAYYDGADGNVYTDNLGQLTGCGATVTFDATPNEFKANN